MSRVVHMKNGFDIQHRADHRRRRGYAAAALQMEKIIHREIVAHMQFELFGVFGSFFQRSPRIRFSDDVIDKQTFAHRGAEGIDHDHFSVGIDFFELFCGDAIAPFRTRKSGRKRDDEHVFSLFEEFFKVRLCGFRGHLISGGHRTGTQLRVKFFFSDFFAVFALVIDVFHQEAEMHAFHVMFEKIRLGQVGGRICDDLKKPFIHTICFSPFPKV